MEKIRVLVIEVNHILREGLREFLGKHSDMSIRTSTGLTDAITHGKSFDPHVIMLNTILGGPINSVQSAKELKKEFPLAKTVIIDILSDNANILRYMKVGISGFILKHATINIFLRDIRAIAGGKKVLPDEMDESLFAQIAEDNREFNMEAPFTKREQEIINFIAKGLSNKEIAENLHISYNTVKSHVHRLLGKFSLRSRVELAKYAYLYEITDLED